jgi:hypothetical protein
VWIERWDLSHPEFADAYNSHARISVDTFDSTTHNSSQVRWRRVLVPLAMTSWRWRVNLFSAATSLVRAESRRPFAGRRRGSRSGRSTSDGHGVSLLRLWSAAEAEEEGPTAITVGASEVDSVLPADQAAQLYRDGSTPPTASHPSGSGPVPGATTLGPTW